MAKPITNSASLNNYIKQLCNSRLGNGKDTSEVWVAINRHAFLHPGEWDLVVKQALTVNFDAEENNISSEREAERAPVDQAVEKIVASIVSGIKEKRAIPAEKRSTPERLVEDYFFPDLYKERNASIQLHNKILSKIDQFDSQFEKRSASIKLRTETYAKKSIDLENEKQDLETRKQDLETRLEQLSDSLKTPLSAYEKQKVREEISQVEEEQEQLGDDWQVFTKKNSGFEKRKSDFEAEKSAFAKEKGELLKENELLGAHIDYLDEVARLPFAAEKFVAALQQNTGKNYTPKQNAQVISALLDTVQKSQEGNWTAEKLLQTAKVIAKMTIPDLPADSVTLESIQDLLPVVNGIMDKGNKLEKQKTEFFSEKVDPKQASARKAIFNAMGVEFTSLSTLCVNSLYKPMQQLSQATGNAMGDLFGFSTWDGKDWIQFLNGVEEAGVAIGTIPKEIRDRLPGFVEYAKFAGDMAAITSGIVSGTGAVVGGLATNLGSAIRDKSSESVKNTADTMLDATAALYRAVGPTVGKVASFASYILPAHYTPYVAKQTYATGGSRLWNALTSILPESVKRKFSDQGEFWAYLKPSTDPAVAEDFFYIHALVEASGSPTLEKEFFDAYMARPEIKVKSSYENYVAFKAKINPEILDTPLDKQLKSFANAESTEKGDKANYMIQRVKKLEAELQRSENSITNFNELAAAMSVQSDDPKVEAFQKFYVRPALDKAALHNQQKQLMPKLEKELDAIYDQLKDKEFMNTLSTNKEAEAAFNTRHEKLRDIYSKLKGGQLLTTADVNDLVKHKVEDDNSLSKIRELASSFPPAEAPKPPKAFTPKEESRQSYQATLDSVHPVLGHISESLKKQLASCEGLRALSPNDPSKSLCDSKINYLKALDKAVTQLMKDIKKDDDLAEEIRKLVGGEIDMSGMLSAQAISKELISLAWETILPTSGLVSASIPEKILAYAMSKNEHLDGIIQAKVKYEKTFKDTPPPPELMTRLSNPLTRNQLTNEELIRKGVGGGLDLLAGFIPGMAEYYALSMPLAYIMPQAVLADVAIGVLSRPEVQAKLFPGPLQALFSTVGGLAGSAKSYVTGMAADKLKDVICPYLNIEVQKILEQKAFEYASKDPSERSTLKKHERESFSGFYLQYRAIKKNNPALDRAACIEYLFSQSLEGKSISERANFVEKIGAEFERVDNALKAQMPPTSQEAELERELEFLMQNVDFNSPSETALVGMCVYNRLMMMQMNASKEVTEEQARQLQQKAMSTLESVLGSLEKADTPTPDQPRTKARAVELQDATKMLAKAKFEELNKELTATSQLIENNIKDRKERLIPESRENEPKLAGRTVLAAELDKAVKVGPSMRAIQTIGNLMTPVIFWAFVGVAITAGGLGLGALTAVGLGSPIGAAILGAVVIAKVAFNTVREVRARDNEFAAIKARTDISPFQKTLLTGLNYLKCFGIGLVKAVVTDTIYNKVTGIFTSGVKPVLDTVAEARDLARKHPKVETLDNEMELLSTLKTDLDKFHTLVKEQIAAKEKFQFSASKPDPRNYSLQASYEADLKAYKDIQVRAKQIKEMGEKIQTQFENAQTDLATSSSGDVRWKGVVNPVNDELESYKAAFGKMTKAMNDVELIQKAEFRMQPEISQHEINANKNAKEADRQLGIVKQFAPSIQVEREKLSTNDQLKNDKNGLKEMAARVRQTIGDMTVATKAAEVQYQSAYAEAGKAGEVGRLSSLTAITGPTLTASNQAQKAWESAKAVVTESQQFLKTIEAELVRNTHEIVVEHTAKVHKLVEQASQASKEVLGERGAPGDQTILAGILEDLEMSDIDINDLDYEDIEEMADRLRAALVVMKSATRLAELSYQKVSQAITIEEAGVQPGQATMTAHTKAKEALVNAQKVEEAARDVLEAIDGVIEEIGYVQKAETQLEKATNFAERIKREQKTFDAMRKVDYEALDSMIEEVADDLDYLSEATRKLEALDQTVSELVKTDPEMQKDSQKVKESLQEAQALERDARQFLTTLQTVRAQKDIETIYDHTSKMDKHLEKATTAAKSVVSQREKFSELMNGLETGKYEEDDIDFALEDIAETLTKKITVMAEATKAATELYNQVSQLVKKIEESGVEIGEFTQLACEKAKAALDKAQQEENKARELLATVEQKIAQIEEIDVDEEDVFFEVSEHPAPDFVKDAEEQLQLITEAQTVISTKGSYLQDIKEDMKEPELRVELAKLAHEEQVQLQKISEAISQLASIYERVSQAATNDPVLVASSTSVKNTLEAARVLESQAQKVYKDVEQAINPITPKDISEGGQTKKHISEEVDTTPTRHIVPPVA